MGFKKQVKTPDNILLMAVNVPESTVRQRLSDGVVDKMKLGYDVGKNNETTYAKYSYVRDDPLAAWPR